jgi:hypothetical protein
MVHIGDTNENDYGKPKMQEEIFILTEDILNKEISQKDIETELLRLD